MKSVMLLTALLAAPALAEDVASLYELSTDGTTAKVKEGEKAKIVIAIVTKPGAHVSDEAPLKIELSSKSGKLEKDKLSLADSLNKKTGERYPTPRFEVGYAPAGKGSGAVDAKLTFFICTDKLCARQTKSLSLAVEQQ